MSSGNTSAALYAAVTSPAQVTGAVPESAPELQHHLKDNKGFRNPWDSWVDQSAFQILSKMIWRRLTGQLKTPDTTPPTVPVQKPNFLPTRETKTLRATWLGHACYYVEFPGGFRALFDPVFECRCSPFTWLGPKRFTEMPCKIEDLPAIDAVVISHNHYDHLSYPTITKIKELHPNAQFFAPLGNKKGFLDSGVHNVTELDWWEERDLKLERVSDAKGGKAEEISVSESGKGVGSDPDSITAKIGCLPCQHTSARTPFDRAKTLWASWSVESGGKKVYFAGDTGYRAVPEVAKDVDDYAMDLPHCPAFAEIGKLRGPFDLGMIPIGAYSPRFIMSPMHANPFDSANIFVDTKCRKALGMHWGTWVLTNEDVMEPPRLLKKALALKGIPETGVFDIVDIGASKEFVD